MLAMKIAGDEVDALVRELREICAKLPAYEEYVMVHHPAFRLGKKPFVIAGMESATKGATLSVNLGPELQHALLDDARFTRTPYIGQHGWVTIARASTKKDELTQLVVGSWRRLANKKQLEALNASAHAPSAGRTADAASSRSKGPRATKKGAAKTKGASKTGSAAKTKAPSKTAGAAKAKGASETAGAARTRRVKAR